jgi:diacylglycerol O-acyltransferase / wax synthase
MTSQGVHLERDMSGPESMMWHIDRDPLLATSGSAVSTFEGELDPERFRTRVANMVASVDRLRQHVEPGAGPLVRPHWTFDRDFDLDWHVRRIGAPGDGSLRAVLDWATQYFQDPLDRTRPLWQYIVVEGMAGRRSALAMKIHHVVADGAMLVRLTEGFIDATPDGPEDGEPPAVDLDALVRGSPTREVKTEPNAVGNVLEYMAGLMRLPIDVTRRALDVLSHPDRLAEAGDETTSLLRTAIDQLRPAGSPLWRERSRRRRFEPLSLSLEDARRAGKALGGTVNDVFMTGAVEGSARYHRLKGADVEHFHVTFVVSVRGDQSGANAFTPVPVELPAAAMPLEQRFTTVHDLLRRRRQEVHGQGPMAAVASVANLMPTALVISMMRDQAGHIDFATSNLPGYRGEPWIAGARLMHTYAFGPVAGTACNLTAVSTGPVLDIGLHADAAAIDDPALLARCMDEAYTDLLAQAP